MHVNRIRALNRRFPLERSTPSDATSPNSNPLLLLEGGPFYRVERYVGLVRKDAPLTVRLAIMAALLTWVPLLGLSWADGTALQNVQIPFLYDFSAYGRFLLGVPLLLLAELIIAPRIVDAAAQFIRAGIVQEKDFGRFDIAVESTLRLRASLIAELIIAAISLGSTWMTFRRFTFHTSTWYWSSSPDGRFTLTPAGWWLILVCLPLLQFLVIRWLWRILLWFRFLREVGKLDLQLFPTHPDSAGGLGFVGETQRFFGFLLFAYSFPLTGVIANEVVYGKLQLQHFGPLIAMWVVLSLLITAAPLAIFTPKLLSLRRRGLHQYGALATAYSRSFHQKWIERKGAKQETLLGSSDIQSLADMGGSFEMIEDMQIIPIAPRSLLQLIATALLPMSALLLTVMSLQEIFDLLMKVVM